MDTPFCISLYPPTHRVSQYGQDFLVHLLMNGRSGFYVDVGAKDGKSISNTFMLEQHGWRGICIEPHPESFAALTAQRKSINLNLAVSDKPGHLDFVQVLSGPTGNSGLLSTYAHRGKLETLDHSIIRVKSETLADILTKCNAPSHIDYLDIDTEGHELQVILSIDFSSVTFGIIGLEAKRESHSFVEISKLLASHGYRHFGTCGSDQMFTSVIPL